MSWKAVIVVQKDGHEYEINSVFSTLSEFAESAAISDDLVVVEIRLTPVDYATFAALSQKSAPRKPWRVDCRYCGGTGRREPTGEAHRAPGLIDCDQCEPLPVRLVTWESNGDL